MFSLFNWFDEFCLWYFVLVVFAVCLFVVLICSAFCLLVWVYYCFKICFGLLVGFMLWLDSNCFVFLLCLGVMDTSVVCMCLYCFMFDGYLFDYEILGLCEGVVCECWFVWGVVLLNCIIWFCVLLVGLLVWVYLFVFDILLFTLLQDLVGLFLCPFCVLFLNSVAWLCMWCDQFVTCFIIIIGFWFIIVYLFVVFVCVTLFIICLVVVALFGCVWVLVWICVLTVCVLFCDFVTLICRLLVCVRVTFVLVIDLVLIDGWWLFVG